MLEYVEAKKWSHIWEDITLTIVMFMASKWRIFWKIKKFKENLSSYIRQSEIWFPRCLYLSRPILDKVPLKLFPSLQESSFSLFGV
jgi:hypothetical protein